MNAQSKAKAEMDSPRMTKAEISSPCFIFHTLIAFSGTSYAPGTISKARPGPRNSIRETGETGSDHEPHSGGNGVGKRGRTTSPIDFTGLRQYSDLAMALWSDIQPLEAALYPKIGSFRVQRVASKTET